MKNMAAKVTLLGSQMLGFSSVGAATLTVSPGENIQAAIDSASPGDTIRVNPGFYHEQLRILRKKDLQILGTVSAEGKRPIISGVGLNENGGDLIFIQFCRRITLAGFVLKKASRDNFRIFDSHHIRILQNQCVSAGQAGIRTERSHHVIIEGNQISDNLGAGIFFDDFNAFHQVIGNTLFRNGAEGIANWQGNLTLIAGNLVRENGGQGIRNGYGYGVRIINNTVEENGSDGIHDISYGSPATVIKANTVWGNQGTGIYTYMFSRVIGNLVENNIAEGISGDYFCTFLNNIVRNNGSRGLYSDQGGLIQGNTVIANREEGIYLSYGDNARVVNNTVKKNREDGIHNGNDVALLAHNITSRNGGSGLFPCYNSVITRANISALNGDYGIYYDDYGNAVQNNLVVDNANTGIGGYAYHSLVEGNTVRNNDGEGITDFEMTVVRNNTVTDNTLNGINAFYSDNGYPLGNYMSDNTCSGNGDGVTTFDLFDAVPPQSWWVNNTGTHNW